MLLPADAAPAPSPHRGGRAVLVVVARQPRRGRRSQRLALRRRPQIDRQQPRLRRSAAARHLTGRRPRSPHGRPTAGSAAMASVLRPTGTPLRRRPQRVRHPASAPPTPARSPGRAEQASRGRSPRRPTIPADGRAALRPLRTAAGAFAAPVTLASLDTDGAPHVALPRLGVTTAWRHVHDATPSPGTPTASRPRGSRPHASWLGRRGAETPVRAPDARAAARCSRRSAIGALVAWLEAPEFSVGTPVRLAVATADGWQPTVTLPLDEPAAGPAAADLRPRRGRAAHGQRPCDRGRRPRRAAGLGHEPAGVRRKRVSATADRGLPALSRRERRQRRQA